jgi:predicted tellurium resistance membrane protein TerC
MNPNFVRKTIPTNFVKHKLKNMFQHLLTADGLIGLITLTFLEIVLGIDNIIFISIAANKLAKADQGKARNIGLLLAMAFRIILLFGISFLISLQQPFFHIDTDWLHVGVSGQSIILFAGGLFLLYKATNEIHHKLEGNAADDHVNNPKGNAADKLTAVVLQIAVINIVFSIDSILTAIGLTNDVTIMILAVIISILIMMVFGGKVGNFVNEHPSIQMLGMAFLLMIGFMLVAEAAHDAHVTFFGNPVGEVPKGYLYFAIAFSLLVEVLNIRLNKVNKPVQLHDYLDQAKDEGLLEK